MDRVSPARPIPVSLTNPSNFSNKRTKNIWLRIPSLRGDRRKTAQPWRCRCCSSSTARGRWYCSLLFKFSIPPLYLSSQKPFPYPFSPFLLCPLRSPPMMPPIHSVISSEPGKLSSFDPFGLSPSGIDMEHVLSLCYLLYLLFGCWSWCRFPFFFLFTFVVRERIY